jgi:heptosyltransferase-1
LRTLIVRLSSIGDVVHTLPAAAALAGRGFEVGWLVEPAPLPLLSANPAVAWATAAPPARAFRLERARAALRSLRGRTCDVALDLQGLWKSAAWARLSGARRVLGFARAWRREPTSALLLGERGDVPAEAVHVIDKNLSLLRLLGVEALGFREFPLPRDAAAARSVETRLAELGLRRYAVLNVGGGWASKLWPASGFGALARALAEKGVASLVTWGPGEGALADEAVAASGGAARRCFPTTLLELLEVLRRALVVAAADTGPLHVACALGTPVVGLYGPTDPARNGPFSPDDRVVRRVPPCAPCHRRSCPVHAGVMATVPVEEVVAAVTARLEIAKGRTSAAQ